jgi:hypothetical protein
MRKGKKFMRWIIDKIGKLCIIIASKCIFYEKKIYKQYKKFKVNTIERLEDKKILTAGCGSVFLNKEDRIIILLNGIHNVIFCNWHIKDDNIKEKAIETLKDYINKLESNEYTPDQS